MSPKSFFLVLLLFLSPCCLNQKAPPKEIPDQPLPPESTEPIPCSALWDCSEWSDCGPDGKQERMCVQQNECDAEGGMPAGAIEDNTPPSTRTCTPTDFNQSDIVVIGDAECIVKTDRALALLKNRSLEDYAFVVKYVGIIECADNYSGMYAWEDLPRFRVGNATRDYSLIWYAGAIVHDSCHSMLYHEYNGSDPVPLDVYTGKDAELECLQIQYDALRVIGADNETLDYVRNSSGSAWWDEKDVWW